MNIDIWKECRGKEHIHSLEEIAWRMVETQHIFSMRKLVDSPEEEILLESLIETTQPKTFCYEFPKLHPLLHTPFRHASLPHGSRFGSAEDRGFWCGSLQFSTLLAEKAYYQFLFLRASMVEYGNILRTFSAFSTKIKTKISVNLSKAPFDAFLNDISSKEHYKTSQALGRAMRKDGIEAVLYPSARDPNQGLNVAIFHPNGFSQIKPEPASFQTWHSLTSQNTMEFKRVNTLKNEYKIHKIDTFMINGKLP